MVQINGYRKRDTLYHARRSVGEGDISEMIRAIGLMSGTSLDGIDAAWLETDGEDRIKAGPSLTLPYTPSFRARLRAILGGGAPADVIEGVATDLTRLHAEAVRHLLDRHGLALPDLIGFHGHTILHRPAERLTWQIGDGAMLAGDLGVPVVADLRSADVAAGGQGAPLVPVFHQALAAGLERPVAVVNIGGVANITWIGETLLAFDTGPGNALIDDWALRHTGKPVDEDGALAAQGRVDQDAVARFLAHPYFALTPPKSLDRDDFAGLVPTGLSAADGAATLVAITVAAIRRAADHLPTPPKRFLITGGGRLNPVLMATLGSALEAPVEPVEALGWDGDAIEAQAFAYLTVRSAKGLPLTFPGTTGVNQPMTGGQLHRPGSGTG